MEGIHPIFRNKNNDYKFFVESTVGV